jgi:hypothetical protein
MDADTAELRRQLERYEDCLRAVCSELELPQSESGPCDDPLRYERAIESLDVLYRNAEAQRALAVDRLHRAETALEPFAAVGRSIHPMWDKERRANTLNIGEIRVKHYRRAAEVLVTSASAPLLAEAS